MKKLWKGLSITAISGISTAALVSCTRPYSYSFDESNLNSISTAYNEQLGTGVTFYANNFKEPSSRQLRDDNSPFELSIANIEEFIKTNIIVAINDSKSQANLIKFLNNPNTKIRFYSNRNDSEELAVVKDSITNNKWNKIWFDIYDGKNSSSKMELNLNWDTNKISYSALNRKKLKGDDYITTLLKTNPTFQVTMNIDQDTDVKDLGEGKTLVKNCQNLFNKISEIIYSKINEEISNRSNTISFSNSLVDYANDVNSINQSSSTIKYTSSLDSYIENYNEQRGEEVAAVNFVNKLLGKDHNFKNFIGKWNYRLLLNDKDNGNHIIGEKNNIDASLKDTIEIDFKSSKDN